MLNRVQEQLDLEQFGIDLGKTEYKLQLEKTTDDALPAGIYIIKNSFPKVLEKLKERFEKEGSKTVWKQYRPISSSNLL